MNDSNICGLNNIGNTCFMNSALQLIVNCTVLTKFILNSNFNNDKLNCYKKFLTDYYSNDVITPNTIKNMVASENNIFSGYCQHDAHEFLITLLDIIHEELKNEYKKHPEEILGISTDKFIDVIFDTNITSIIYCDEIDHKSKTKIGEKILSLAIPDTKSEISLEDCMNKFSEIDKLSGDSKWFYDKNNKYYDAYKRLYIKSYSKYLIIQLKRFNYINGSRKNNTPVKMNYNIDIKNDSFTLRSIVFHMGGAGGGHYVSLINKNDVWYLCNDSSISKINNIDNYIQQGYIYLYVRSKK